MGARKWFFIEAKCDRLHRVEDPSAYRARCGTKLAPGYELLTRSSPRLSARAAARIRCRDCRRAMTGKFE